MWRFEQSSALTYLILVPILLILFLWSYRRWKKISSQVFGQRVSAYLLQSYSVGKSFIKTILLCLVLTGMIFAWARPQVSEGQTEVKSEGVEIMILMDVSKSMLAEDVRPSRLEHAKKEVMRLLDMLGGDKVGLIAFAGSSVLLSPLTVDKSALKMFVEGLTPESVQTQGTEIGPALKEAKDAFQRGGVENDEKSRATKVVLLISDGEDHEAGAEKIAKEMLNDGIRLFTMAFGTEAGSKVPLRDARGMLIQYLRDNNNREVLSRVKGDFLRSLASIGRGSFYHVTFGGEQMKSVKEDLEALEKAEFDTTLAASYEEKYQWILGLALFFALVELLLGNRAKLPTRWKGRFPV